MILANNKLDPIIAAAKLVAANAYDVTKIISLLDLTSLNDTDNDAVITTLCQHAQTNFGDVAAICISPQFVAHAKKILSQHKIKLATVANFPKGDSPLLSVISAINQSIVDGADEIDVVIPYQNYLLDQDEESITNFVTQCKQACGAKIILKVILETGALSKQELIYNASRAAIQGGTDFIKTSTGKINVNATLEAAAIMLQAIKDTGMQCGFKAAGGIRTQQQAASYLYLAEQICSAPWVEAKHFRLGASSLLDELINTTN